MATELVGIELELRGEEGVFRDLEKLDNMLKGFSGAKGKQAIELDLGQSKQRLLELNGAMNDVRENIDSMKKHVKELRNEMKDIAKGSDEFDEMAERIRNANNYIDEETAYLKRLQTEYRDVTQRVNELNTAQKNAQKSWKQMFNEMSTGIKHIGQNMQTLGNALTKIGSPFKTITQGFLYGAGYKALNIATEGLESAFSRYDTMKKYPRMMKQLGLVKEASEAEASIKRLDEAVTGLPTSLDEIVNMTQLFAASLGDMDRAEKVAIATNNAFLASGTDAATQYQGMLQLRDLLNGKDLNAREWMSLTSSMGPAIREMGKELGYHTNEELQEFIQLVNKGDLSTQEFLDTLVKIGVGKDSVLGQMAQLSVETWDGLVRNSKAAFSRIGFHALEALDEVAEAYNGKSILQNLLTEKGIFDQWDASIQKWIRSHPNEIIDFFNQLKEIDFKGLGRGMLNGIKTLAETAKLVSSALGGKGLEKIGWFITIAGPLGRAINLTGGLLKGLSHPLAILLATIGKGTMMTMGEMEKSGGIMGMLGKVLGGKKGAKAAKETVETMEAMGEAGTAAPKMGKFATGLSSFFRGWGQVMTMIGGTALVGWGSMKLIKGTVKTFKETVDVLNTVDWNMGAKLIGGITTFMGATAGLSALAGHFASQSGTVLVGEVIVGLFSTIATGFAALDMKLVKSTVKSLSETVGYLKSAITGLNELGEVADSKASLDRAAKAVEIFNDVRDVFKGKVDHFSGETVSGLKGFTKNTTKSVKNIADTIGNMKTAIEALNEMAGMKLKTKGVEELAPKLTEALSSLRTAINAIPKEWKESGVVDATGNMSGSIANLKTSMESIVGENGILSMIPKLVARVHDLDRSGSLDELPNKMKALGAALKATYDALNSGIGNGEFMSSNLSNLREALKQARLAVHHINELGKTEVSSKGLDNISSLVEGVKSAFNTDALSGITEPINEFVQAIKDALKSFEELNQEIEIDITFKLSSGFYSSKDKVIREIKNAKKDINAQRGGISYSIPVSVFFSVVTNVGSALAKIARDKQTLVNNASTGSTPINPIITGHDATGGRISRSGVLYRSGGGSIFKPRGTDRIPAMLTEGEYVHKKQAVDFFGTDFMQKVNAMDVRGAMQALLTKAGNATNIGRQSIVNNTVNNNQRITQNISTNNPNFAGARMGRFVGAL